MSENKWIVARFSALGDVVLTTGVLNFWHQTKGWRFVVLTREGLAPIFKNHPAVDEIIVLNGDQLKFPQNLAKFRQLAQDYSDYGLLDLHDSLRTRLLSSVWKGRVRRYPKLGIARRLFLFSGHKLCEEKLLSHNVPQRYAMAVDNPPPLQEKLVPYILLDANELLEAKKLLLERNIDLSKPCVALHPYATHHQKAWPKKNWLELIELLRQKGIAWFVLGQEKDIALQLNLASDETGFDFTNYTDIRTTCALLAQANLLLTGDSGPMHLATAVGTPVLGLFGPTTRHWGFFPSGPKDQVLEADCSGRPFSLHGKSTGATADNCMQLILADVVMEKITALLKEV